MILNVILYSFFAHLTYRGAKIPVAPQHSLLAVVPRQVFAVRVPHAARRHLFQAAYDLQYRERRTRLHEQVDVVPVNTNFQDSEVALRRNVIEASRQRLFDTDETVLSVLRAEDKVVTYVYLRVVERVVLLSHVGIIS